MSRHVAAQRRRPARAHDRRRPVADADAERAGHGRPDGAGDADRARHLRARRVHRRATPPATAAALQFYAIGLVGYSVVRIASPAFYALGQNRTPVIVSIVTVLVNAALNIALVRVLGLSRPGARHVDRRAVQRRAAAVPAAAAAWTASRAAALAGRSSRSSSRRRRWAPRRIARRPAAGRCAAWRRARRRRSSAWRRRSASRWSCWPLPRMLLRIREFHAGVALVTRRFRRTRR